MSWSTTPEVARRRKDPSKLPPLRHRGQLPKCCATEPSGSDLPSARTDGVTSPPGLSTDLWKTTWKSEHSDAGERQTSRLQQVALGLIQPPVASHCGLMKRMEYKRAHMLRCDRNGHGHLFSTATVMAQICLLLPNRFTKLYALPTGAFLTGGTAGV